MHPRSHRRAPGPMAAEVDGLALLMHALCAGGKMHALDPTVPGVA